MLFLVFKIEVIRWSLHAKVDLWTDYVHFIHGQAIIHWWFWAWKFANEVLSHSSNEVCEGIDFIIKMANWVQMGFRARVSCLSHVLAFCQNKASWVGSFMYAITPDALGTIM